MPYNTLYDYYTSKGAALPTPSARFSDPNFAAAAAKAGVTREAYTAAGSNNADLNSRIVAALNGVSGAGGGTPPVGGGAGTGTGTTGNANAQTNPGASGADTGTSNISQSGLDIGNFTAALRAALNEAGQMRVAGNYQAIGSVGTDVTPGTMKSVVDLIKGSVSPSVEGLFKDFSTAYKDASEEKKKELDQVRQLRLEFGSAIPANVTTVDEALKYAAPLIDAERDLDRKTKLAAIAEKAKTTAQSAQDVDFYAGIYAGIDDPAEARKYLDSLPQAIQAQVGRAGAVKADANRKTYIDDLKGKIDKMIKSKARSAKEWKEQIDTDYANNVWTDEEYDELIAAIDNSENERKNGPAAPANPLMSKAPPNMSVAPAGGQSTGGGATGFGGKPIPPLSTGMDNYSPNAGAQAFLDLFGGLVAK